MAERQSARMSKITNDGLTRRMRFICTHVSNSGHQRVKITVFLTVFNCHIDLVHERIVMVMVVVVTSVHARRHPKCFTRLCKMHESRYCGSADLTAESCVMSCDFHVKRCNNGDQSLWRSVQPFRQGA